MKIPYYPYDYAEDDEEDYNYEEDTDSQEIDENYDDYIDKIDPK